MLTVASQLPIGTRLEKWFCATYVREQTVKRWREGIKVSDVNAESLRTLTSLKLLHWPHKKASMR